ncbi:MAG TPA: DUF4126 family protein [Capillimicrobium sp.]|nr:DUF4126 family protein [Capillimicrobium sp.]
MRLFLDICTGAGVSASSGIRPFLPALATGALASADAGIDFEGTDFAFLEGFWFLLAVLLALIVVVGLQRARGADFVESGPVGAAIAGLAIGIGAVLFAGTLADHGYAWWPGLIGGAACAALGQAAARGLFDRVRARVEPAVRDALVVYADGAALVGAVLSILVPPLAIVLLAFLVWLLLGGRRRAGEKYAGLRILR